MGRSVETSKVFSDESQIHCLLAGKVTSSQSLRSYLHKARVKVISVSGNENSEFPPTQDY